MKFTLSIDSDNAAFTDAGAAHTIAELLEQTAQQVRDEMTSGYLRDYNNGQAVGYWKFGGPDRTPAQQSADTYLAQARMDPSEEDALTEEDVYAENVLTSAKIEQYLLEGGGPSVWLHVIRGSLGRVDFGVFEHSHAGPSTYAVLPAHDTEVVVKALGRSREES